MAAAVIDIILLLAQPPLCCLSFNILHDAVRLRNATVLAAAAEEQLHGTLTSCNETYT